MDKGVVVDIGNDIEGFVPISQLHPEGKPVNSPTDVVYETMNLDMRVLEVDPDPPPHRARRDEYPGRTAAASRNAVEGRKHGRAGAAGYRSTRVLRNRRHRVVESVRM